MTCHARHRFTCPDCREQIEVNGAMRAALLERGCVVCGAVVPAGAFSTV